MYRDQWLTSNFILQYHWWIKHKGYENKENDQYVKEPLIDKSIPLDNTIGYVHRTVRRICMLILGCRGLIKRALLQPLKITVFIISLTVPFVNVKRIQCSDWLTEWARWAHRAHSRYTAEIPCTTENSLERT